MSDLIRSATLTHYPEVAQSVGIDPRAMLRKVRLPLESLERPDLRIAVSSLRRLLEASASASGVEEFGLLMAERGALANLGPVALVVREQATIGDALKALARFIHIHHEGMRLSIEPQDDVVMLAVGLRALPRAPRQSSEMALGSLHRIIRALAGEDWRPLEAHLTHPPPRNRKYYRSFFGCQLVFNAEVDALAISARDLDRPIPSSHPLIANYLEKRVEAIDVRPRQWDERVAEVVRALLNDGDCTVERVAGHFGCTRRTIHRHLAECGTSFSQVLDAERADLALRLIEDRSRPLAAVAGMLGFSAQSAMARWFKGRFGRSITEWRSDAREQALAAIRRW
ncbi:AraC family transcriptional regulator [Bradyrhizobium sp.]|uniref:AraC family transcriptional regulator n=1 Tax=Bradyrhizobium sp. TaxID=376 RepID=UPI001D48D663|nr:AraC family transcriptional regulator [Bradyrhizobium sp.]MBI5322766.1 AraC family transcriptional regulator [Bradyrhizobium sp.]